MRPRRGGRGRYGLGGDQPGSVSQRRHREGSVSSRFSPSARSRRRLLDGGARPPRADLGVPAIWVWRATPAASGRATPPRTASRTTRSAQVAEDPDGSIWIGYRDAYGLTHLSFPDGERQALRWSISPPPTGSSRTSCSFLDSTRGPIVGGHGPWRCDVSRPHAAGVTMAARTA